MCSLHGLFNTAEDRQQPVHLVYWYRGGCEEARIHRCETVTTISNDCGFGHISLLIFRCILFSRFSSVRACVPDMQLITPGLFLRYTVS